MDTTTNFIPDAAVNAAIVGLRGATEDGPNSFTPASSPAEIAPPKKRGHPKKADAKASADVASNGGSVVDLRPQGETQTSNEVDDARFADPLVLEIRELWRHRRRFLKARNALILQGKAFGRMLADGDKDKGSSIFDEVKAGKSTSNLAVMAISPFIDGINRFDDEVSRIEKTLAKSANRLPIAHMVDQIDGFGLPGLAAIVGECGDLSAYRTISGVWKRAGLAVIDGQRQRRVADAEQALVHAYSPERRSAIWNVAEPLARRQRTWTDKETGEIKKEPGPYGIYLEREKAKALAAGCKPAHAEARARRHMTKRLLLDLTVEWRRVAGRADTTAAPGKESPAPFAIAAE